MPVLTGQRQNWAIWAWLKYESLGVTRPRKFFINHVPNINPWTGRGLFIIIIFILVVYQCNNNHKILPIKLIWKYVWKLLTLCLWWDTKAIQWRYGRRDMTNHESLWIVNGTQAEVWTATTSQSVDGEGLIVSAPSRESSPQQ